MNGKYFLVLKRVPLHKIPVNQGETQHILDRFSRLDTYTPYLSTDFLYAFLVDTGCPGKEIHAINKNGLVYVYSQPKHKLITILHPRKQQIVRYFVATATYITPTMELVVEQVEFRNRMMQLNEK